MVSYNTILLEELHLFPSLSRSKTLSSRGIVPYALTSSSLLDEPDGWTGIITRGIDTFALKGKSFMVVYKTAVIRSMTLEQIRFREKLLGGSVTTEMFRLIEGDYPLLTFLRPLDSI